MVGFFTDFRRLFETRTAIGVSSALLLRTADVFGFNIIFSNTINTLYAHYNGRIDVITDCIAASLALQDDEASFQVFSLNEKKTRCPEN